MLSGAAAAAEKRRPAGSEREDDATLGGVAGTVEMVGFETAAVVGVVFEAANGSAEFSDLELELDLAPTRAQGCVGIAMDDDIAGRDWVGVDGFQGAAADGADSDIDPSPSRGLCGATEAIIRLVNFGDDYGDSFIRIEVSRLCLAFLQGCSGEVFCAVSPVAPSARGLLRTCRQDGCSPLTVGGQLPGGTL